MEDRETYQTETPEQDETELTVTEARTLGRFARLNELYTLDFALTRLSQQERLLIASAVSRIGEALDKSMPGWRGK